MKMKWNLRVLMAENEVDSATELMRRLEGVGVKISTAQASRIVKEMPSRLSVNILRGLLEIFQCHPNDLIVIEHEISSDDDSKRVRRISPRAKSAQESSGLGKINDPKQVEQDASLTGPKVRTFPVKDRE